MAPFGKKNYEFPIDVVFTWVNGEDSSWLDQKHMHEKKIFGERGSTNEESDSFHFRDNDELKYSLRSFAKFAPWVRTIYVVTANQKPQWLNTEKVKLISHEDIFPRPELLLPVFSPRPIEFCVHLIPGLSEHFIYANDDFMLGSPVTPKDFFLPDGSPYVWVSKKQEAQEALKLQLQNTSHESATQRAEQVARQMFGVDFPYEIGNYPKAMTIDTMRQMWELFHEAVANTLFSPFCSDSDIPCSILYSIFLLVTGQGKAKEMQPLVKRLFSMLKGRKLHMGVDLGNERLNSTLEKIERKKPKTFCLNDCSNATAFDRLLMRTFLEKIFPESSPFEL